MKTFKFASAFACIALFAAQAVSAGSLPVFTSAAPTTLIKDNLADFLRAAGHDPSPTDNGDLMISAPLFGQTQKFGVGLSKDATRLWVYAKIASFPTLAGISADTFSRLLMANEDYGPAHFAIERCEKCSPDRRYTLWFNESLENRGITPASFRAAVDTLVKDLTNTADLWDQKNLKH